MANNLPRGYWSSLSCTMQQGIVVDHQTCFPVTMPWITRSSQVLPCLHSCSRLYFIRSLNSASWWIISCIHKAHRNIVSVRIASLLDQLFLKVRRSSALPFLGITTRKIEPTHTAMEGNSLNEWTPCLQIFVEYFLRDRAILYMQSYGELPIKSTTKSKPVWFSLRPGVVNWIHNRFYWISCW